MFRACGSVPGLWEQRSADYSQARLGRTYNASVANRLLKPTWYGYGSSSVGMVVYCPFAVAPCGEVVTLLSGILLEVITKTRRTKKFIKDHPRKLVFLGP